MERSAERGRDTASLTSEDDGDRCTYLHDVSEFDDVEGNQWRCPRPTHSDQSLCWFHLPPDQTAETRADGDAFLNAVGSSDDHRAVRRERRRFFGARFDGLDLEHATIDPPDNYPIDLRDAHFEGDLNLAKAVVRLPVWLNQATVNGDVLLHRTRFAEHVILNELTCSGDLICDRATFDRNLDAEEAMIEGSVDCEEAVFGHYLGFIGTRVDGTFSLHNAVVGDNAHLHHMHISGEADFSNVDVAHRFWCFHSTFEGSFEMEKATVGGPAFFDYTEFAGTVNHWNTTFEGRVRWKETVFGDEIAADELATESTARFRRPTFGADVDLSHLDAPAGLWITDPTVSNAACCIDLKRASIESGQLDRAVEGHLTYDFTEATIGDVQLRPERSTGFVDYHFDRTRFEGFDFAAYHDVFDRNNWRLDPGEGSESGPDFRHTEETYLKAKNGAKLVGDATAAAEFFRKEMTYRRYNHARRAKDSDESRSDRLKAAGRWFSSTLLNVTTGYGERPWRVVGCSVGIMGLFVLIYAAAFSAPPYNTPFGYVVFSVESFVALVLGGAPRIELPLIRFIAQVEGFMGAFFIALFVFTLTRSVQR